ncbi:hypothetical protein LAG90_17985 [Marinilongibacter aquaticus]|uniref:hypothetical protein n=1 Tax=Marinilongibacter aquaticus TaxID=2975157 RepID=UPI0021BDD508|nr:hypothetical protein [Marinilongibacter aquaticus]UBM58692.1 hypothetical protein LAG90_17985 [Marinilongibacter aquaticus]
MPELSPVEYDSSYFLALKESFRTFSTKDWRYHYGKDMQNYDNAEMLFSLPRERLLTQVLSIDEDSQILELNTPDFKQVILIPNINTLLYDEFEMDSLNILLYDSLSEPQSISTVIEKVGDFFSNDDMENNRSKFQDLILSRILEAIYNGSIKWIN